MAYQICISKNSPCCAVINPSICTTIPQNIRTIEVYGCTPDILQGEFNDSCVQGTWMPVGCCCAFCVPQNVYSMTIEMWGAGAGGGAGSTSSCCGQSPGGGAGAYVKRTISVCPGDLITLCAGAGGLMGKSGGSSYLNSSTAFVGASGSCSNNYQFCCCGTQGSCSFVMRNGLMCINAYGGAPGQTTCGYQCGIVLYGCGSAFANSVTDDGQSYACSNYTADMKASPSDAFVPGCQTNGYTQVGLSAGAAFGGDRVIWGYSCNCWNYLRWNTCCKNSAGVYGPGGDSCSTSTAYNVGNNYCCSTNNCYMYCDRGNPSPTGYFPGGGGGGGYSSACCYLKTAGGSGAPGYIRVYY